MKRGTIAVSGGGSGYDPTHGSGSSTFHYWDGDAFVEETHRFHQGQKLITIEHLRLEPGKQFIYKHEVTGPGQKHDEREIVFPITKE